MTDEILERTYLNEIKKFPLLTKEQEIVIIKKIQQGDEDAKKTLIYSNLTLPVKIAKNYVQYITDEISFFDLVQEGNLELIKAIEKYDINYNVRFADYAKVCIKRRINRFLMNNKQLIRIPISEQNEIKKLEQIINDFSLENGSEPTDLELVELSGVPIEKIIHHKKAMLLGEIESLDADISPNKLGLTLLDLLANDDPSVEDESYYLELCDNIKTLLSRLNYVEQQIINMLFYFPDGEFSYSKVAETLGLSEWKVRTTKDSALQKMKKMKECKYYKD